MAEILKGAPVAAAITDKVAAKVEALKDRGITPTLAIVRVGESPDDLTYENAAMKRAEKAGIEVRNEIFPSDVSGTEFLSALSRINRDDKIHGILMMQPLPAHIDSEAAKDIIDPAKDVDGCTKSSMAGVCSNTELGFPPCTAEAAMEMLHFYNVKIEGKKAAVIGRSEVIGRPVAMMLMHANATVINCHTRTEDVPAITRDADILIAAAGRLRSVTAEFTNPDQTIIDVGINWDEQNQSIAGDVDFDKVEPLVKAISPVPAGVGSVTTSVLMKHVAEAAERIAADDSKNEMRTVTEEGMSAESIEMFLGRLGSSEPVPGGGGASALTGAIGAALGSMVGALTVGKKKYVEVEEDIKALMEETRCISDALLACIDKDAEMFLPLSEAYRIPKDDPGRDEIMEKCLRDAAATPLKIMELSARAIELLEDFAEKGSKLAVSDAATGAMLCRGAIYGAAVNVKVNTRLMKDRDYAVKLDQKADAILREYSARADAVFSIYYHN